MNARIQTVNGGALATGTTTTVASPARVPAIHFTKLESSINLPLDLLFSPTIQLKTMKSAINLPLYLLFSLAIHMNVWIQTVNRGALATGITAIVALPARVQVSHLMKLESSINLPLSLLDVLSLAVANLMRFSSS